MTASLVRVLGVSGSLRIGSSHTEVLRAATLVAPPNVSVVLFAGLAELPHFNPDRDGEPYPDAVAAWKDAVRRADALLFATPEYAHGLPGVLKNALDWLVSGKEAPGKLVASLRDGNRGAWAQESLLEVLRTMSTVLVPAACASAPLGGRKLDAAGIAADPTLAATLRGALEALSREVAAGRAGG